MPLSNRITRRRVAGTAEVGGVADAILRVYRKSANRFGNAEVDLGSRHKFHITHILECIGIAAMVDRKFVIHVGDKWLGKIDRKFGNREETRAAIRCYSGYQVGGARCDCKLRPRRGYACALDIGAEHHFDAAASGFDMIYFGKIAIGNTGCSSFKRKSVPCRRIAVRAGVQWRNGF